MFFLLCTFESHVLNHCFLFSFLFPSFLFHKSGKVLLKIYTLHWHCFSIKTFTIIVEGTSTLQTLNVIGMCNGAHLYKVAPWAF